MMWIPHLIGSLKIEAMKPAQHAQVTGMVERGTAVKLPQQYTALWEKKKDLQHALQVLAFLVGPPGVEPGTNGL